MQSINDLAQHLIKIVPGFLHPRLYRRYFRLWEDYGFHLTPVTYSSPIPDIRQLPGELWERDSELIGIDMNAAAQLDLLERGLSQFWSECSRFPTGPTSDPNEFHLNNTRFAGADAFALYTMVRYFQPGQIIEVGSGYSTRISALAARRNGHTRLLCIDPHPDIEVVDALAGVGSFVEMPVQDVGLDVFHELQSGDILFIDTSHVLRIGGDLPYLYLEVLPRLQPGVIVHIHDIFFPKEYPKRWVLDELRFYSEQYLLQAFLMFNSSWEVLLCNSYLSYKHQQALEAAFPMLRPAREHSSGSFWMRRKS